jgi:hypothetical protein
MWYHPASFFVEKRDVIGAWVICLAVAVVFFGYPVVMTALDVSAEDLHTATAGRSPGR